MLIAIIGAVVGRGEGGGVGCALPLAGSRATLEGRFLASPRSGSAPFRSGTGCGSVTVVISDTSIVAGVPVTLVGTWMPGQRRPWFRASEGRLAGVHGERETRVGTISWAAVRWRDGLVRRLERLYGERAPLVAALTLARREGMDRALNETFARTGIAHLLAISGFHVGVLAGAALALLRLARVERRRAGLGSAALAWAYVALIGFPAAACRAALILALVAIAKARGRPPARWGALATALLILLVIDASKLASPGFQLSFVGAAGLVAWARPVTTAIRHATAARCPQGVASGLGVGVAATLATLPVVAWHFERVSLVGIPVTLAATPLVSLALPGAIASVMVDLFSPGFGAFLAGGVDVLLGALEWGTGRVAEWSWASAWTSRASVVAGLVGCAIGSSVARHPRVRGRGRRAIVTAYVALGLVAWPLLVTLRGWGTVEVLMIDVGQGDAIALRSPRGRWLLVDAGPPLRAGQDPGAHPVVRALRARGVGRLEAFVLTHPDLDHIGGATAVIASFDIGTVYDPALPAGTADYLEVLAAAAEASVPWVAARAGKTIGFDGVTVQILHPADPLASEAEVNQASVVLRVNFGDFDALLTGDAYKDAERRIAVHLTDIELLKLGHHGSDTSTDSLLLALTRPQAAIVSVGRANRYGHPDPHVLGRLERAGIAVHRTDLDGTISVTARTDGTFTVRTEREGRAGVFGRGG